MRGKHVAGDTSHDSDGGGIKIVAKQLEGEVMLGDIMWVKLRGDSWWPALVVDENTISESSKPGNRVAGAVLVRLYGTYEYFYVDPIECHSEFQIVLKRNNGCYRDIFEKALEQECHHLKSGRSKGKGSRSTGKVVNPNSSGIEYTKSRTHKNDEVLKKQKLGRPSSGTSLLRKSHELSERKLRVMQSLGLIAPSGSPFSKNGRIYVSL